MCSGIANVVSAIVYGVSDFLGGLAARRIPAILVSAVGFAVAAVLIAVATPLVGSVWSSEAILLGLFAGVVGPAALWAFYVALAIGPMSVISPTVAAIAALVPAVGGIMQGERFTALGYVALAALIVGRQTGGNVSAILEESAAGLREMTRLQGALDAKTSESRMQVMVMLGIPFAVVLAIHQIDPEWLEPLSSSSMGIVASAIAAGLWLAAVVLALRILDVILDQKTAPKEAIDAGKA